jgi:hypothetical protein
VIAFEYDPGASGAFSALTLGATVNIWHGDTRNSAFAHELYHSRQYTYFGDTFVPMWVIGGIWGLLSSAIASNPQWGCFPAANPSKGYGNPLEATASTIDPVRCAPKASLMQGSEPSSPGRTDRSAEALPAAIPPSLASDTVPVIPGEEPDGEVRDRLEHRRRRAHVVSGDQVGVAQPVSPNIGGVRRHQSLIDDPLSAGPIELGPVRVTMPRKVGLDHIERKNGGNHRGCGSVNHVSRRLRACRWVLLRRPCTAFLLGSRHRAHEQRARVERDGQGRADLVPGKRFQLPASSDGRQRQDRLDEGEPLADAPAAAGAEGRYAPRGGRGRVLSHRSGSKCSGSSYRSLRWWTM